jgi:HicA toxin of bacterial toxin-antitoxin,
VIPLLPSPFLATIAASGGSLMALALERQRGSHPFVSFNGRTSVVPNHGAKEIPEPLRKKIMKDLGL